MKINKSAVKKYALTCSEQMRAGKFKRVGQAFLDDVEIEVEAIIRKITGTDPDRMPVPPDGTVYFVASEVMPSIVEKLNRAITQVIARKVHRHPSVGKTLQD